MYFGSVQCPRRPQQHDDTLFLPTFRASLIPWNRVHFRKIAVAQLLKILTTFYDIRSFITHSQEPASVRIISQMNPVQSLALHFITIYRLLFIHDYNYSFCLPPAFTLVSCSAYFFDPEDGGDMFLRNVGWQRTTRRYIPEDGALHSRRCESLKYYTIIIVCEKYKLRCSS
jgi:hypothetical protein